MKRITYTVTIDCEDEDEGTDAMTELVNSVIAIGNSYDVTARVSYVGTVDKPASELVRDT
jgi:hypothetical protein